MLTTCQCPRCYRRLQAPDDVLGQEVQCPACGLVFVARATGTRTLAPYPSETKPAPEPGAEAEPLPDVLPIEEEEIPFAEPVAETEPARPPRRRRRPGEERSAEAIRSTLPGAAAARTAVALLVFYIVASLGLIGLAYASYRCHVAPFVFRGGEFLMEPLPSLSARTDVQMLTQIVLPCTYGLMLLTMLAVCLWLYRVRSNVAELRVSGLQYTPGWLIGSFFIPIAQLIIPCLAVQEIWKASDPAAPLQDRASWRRRPLSALVILWWLCWLLFLGLSLAPPVLEFRPSSDDNFALVVIHRIAGIITALLLILLIGRLRQRQADKYNRIMRWQSEA